MRCTNTILKLFVLLVLKELTTGQVLIGEFAHQLDKFLESFGSCTTHIVLFSNEYTNSWGSALADVVPNNPMVKKWSIFASNDSQKAIYFHSNFAYLHSDGPCSIVVFFDKVDVVDKSNDFLLHNLQIKRSTSSFVFIVNSEEIANPLPWKYSSNIYFHSYQTNKVYYYCSICSTNTMLLEIYEAGNPLDVVISALKLWNFDGKFVYSSENFARYMACPTGPWTLTKSSTVYIEKECATSIILLIEVFSAYNTSLSVQFVDLENIIKDWYQPEEVHGYVMASTTLNESNIEKFPIDTITLLKLRGLPLFYCFDKFIEQKTFALLGVWAAPFDLWIWFCLILSMALISALIALQGKKQNLFN